MGRNRPIQICPMVLPMVQRQIKRKRIRISTKSVGTVGHSQVI